MFGIVWLYLKFNGVVPAVLYLLVQYTLPDASPVPLSSFSAFAASFGTSLITSDGTGDWNITLQSCHVVTWP